ncbi:hypothetical protein GCM10010517_21990 [Streptosporangium fragile]|uniref:Uncharacterized protein n=1 Tax=Streptosporangium fragile TaxID=46186 RepID=A0ABP6IBV7_9ACTN
MNDNDRPSAGGLMRGAAAGLAGAVAGAAGYGALLGAAGYGAGFAAVGVGLLTGLAAAATRPRSPALPPLCALLSLAGAAAGQFAGHVVIWAGAAGEKYGTALAQVLDAFPRALKEEPVSFLFWAAAACAGFAVAHRGTGSARAVSTVPQPDEADHAGTAAPDRRP